MPQNSNAANIIKGLLNPQSQKELNAKRGLKGKKGNKGANNSNSGANYQDSNSSKESLAEPTMAPSSEARLTPSSSPSAEPSTDPSLAPFSQPSLKPSSSPLAKPSMDPSSAPSSQPSLAPSGSPSAEPSTAPSSAPSSPSLASMKRLLISELNGQRIRKGPKLTSLVVQRPTVLMVTTPVSSSMLVLSSC
jgi:hypothetical protein